MCTRMSMLPTYPHVTSSSVGRARPASIDILPKRVLEIIFDEEIDILYTSDLSEGWRSLNPAIANYAHTCHNFRRLFLPLIYGRLHVYKLSTLSHLAEIFACDPERKIAKCITYLHWDWNPCGMYSSIWGLAGALCNRAELLKKVNRGLYEGVPSLNLFGAVAPNVQTVPASWPYPSSRFTPWMTHSENEGPDGDPIYPMADPLEIFQLLYSIVQYLDCLTEIKWNAAAVPIPPHLFNILPHPTKITKLSLYNEHNLGDPLVSAYAHLPSSIGELRLCFHASPDIQTPDFAAARCDAQNQYYHDYGIATGTEDWETLRPTVRKCLQWWDDSQTPPVMWPPLGDDAQRCAGGEPKVSSNGQGQKGTVASPNTDCPPSNSGSETTRPSSGHDANPSEPLLPWPWTAAKEPKDDSRKVNHFGHRALARRIRELVESGSLKKLFVCQRSTLHQRVLKEEFPDADQSRIAALSFFEDSAHIPLWLQLNLGICPCNRDIDTMASHPLSAFADAAPVSFVPTAGATSLFNEHANDTWTRPWTSASMFSQSFNNLLSDYIWARRESGHHLKLCVGQPLSITPQDIECVIEHFGWISIDVKATIAADEPVFNQDSQPGRPVCRPDLHRQAITGLRTDVLPRLGGVQIPLYSDPEAQRQLARQWNATQVQHLTEWAAKPAAEKQIFFNISSPTNEQINHDIPFSLRVALDTIAISMDFPEDDPLRRMLSTAAQDKSKQAADWTPLPLATNLEGICTCCRCEGASLASSSLSEGTEMGRSTAPNSPPHPLSRSNSSPEPMYQGCAESEGDINKVTGMGRVVSGSQYAQERANEEIEFPHELEVGRATPSSELESQDQQLDTNLDVDMQGDADTDTVQTECLREADAMLSEDDREDASRGEDGPEDIEVDAAAKQWKGKGRATVDGCDYAAANATPVQTQTEAKGKGRQMMDDTGDDAMHGGHGRKRYKSEAQVILTEDDLEVVDAGSLEEAFRRRGGVMLDQEGPMERYERMKRERRRQEGKESPSDQEHEEEELLSDQEYEDDDNPMLEIPDVYTNDLYTPEKAREWERQYRADAQKHAQGFKEVHHTKWEDMPLGPPEDIDEAEIDEEDMEELRDQQDAEAWKAANMDAAPLLIDGLGPSASAFERRDVPDVPDESETSTPTQSTPTQATLEAGASFGGLFTSQASTSIAGQREESHTGYHGAQEKERFSTTAMVREIKAIDDANTQQSAAAGVEMQSATADVETKQEAVDNADAEQAAFLEHRRVTDLKEEGKE